MLDTPARPMAEQAQPSLETWRCKACNRILAKVRLGPGSHIEVKCSSCNRYAERSRDAP